MIREIQQLFSNIAFFPSSEKTKLKKGEIRTKQPENSFFRLFWGIWAPQNRPKKVLNGPQVDKMYGSMAWLENEALTKSINPFL